MYSMEFIQELLQLFDKYDQHDDLMWRTGRMWGGGNFEEPASFMVRCNDTFEWGCADMEDVTPDNLPLLRSAFEDCHREHGYVGTTYATMLFVARVRQMRPQGAAYPPDDLGGIIKLLNECGPEREVGLGNPRPAPSV